MFETRKTSKSVNSKNITPCDILTDCGFLGADLCEQLGNMVITFQTVMGVNQFIDTGNNCEVVYGVTYTNKTGDKRIRIVDDSCTVLFDDLLTNIPARYVQGPDCAIKDAIQQAGHTFVVGDQINLSDTGQWICSEVNDSCFIVKAVAGDKFWIATNGEKVVYDVHAHLDAESLANLANLDVGCVLYVSPTEKNRLGIEDPSCSEENEYASIPFGIYEGPNCIRYKKERGIKGKGQTRTMLDIACYCDSTTNTMKNAIKYDNNGTIEYDIVDVDTCVVDETRADIPATFCSEVAPENVVYEDNWIKSYDFCGVSVSYTYEWNINYIGIPTKRSCFENGNLISELIFNIS